MSRLNNRPVFQDSRNIFLPRLDPKFLGTLDEPLRKISTFQKEIELRRRELEHLTPKSIKRREQTSLETFMQNDEPGTVPEKCLASGATTIQEHEDVSRQRVVLNLGQNHPL